MYGHQRRERRRGSVREDRREKGEEIKSVRQKKSGPLDRVSNYRDTGPPKRDQRVIGGPTPTVPVLWSPLVRPLGVSVLKNPRFFPVEREKPFGLRDSSVHTWGL